MNLNSVSSYRFTPSVKPITPTPPPAGNIENRRPPSEPQKPVNTQHSCPGINSENLQKLETIVNEHSDGQEQNITKQAEFNSKLEHAGLLRPGAILDIIA